MYTCSHLCFERFRRTLQGDKKGHGRPRCQKVPDQLAPPSRTEQTMGANGLNKIRKPWKMARK